MTGDLNDNMAALDAPVKDPDDPGSEANPTFSSISDDAEATERGESPSISRYVNKGQGQIKSRRHRTIRNNLFDGNPTNVSKGNFLILLIFLEAVFSKLWRICW
ncbi:unnamed protein product [Haemonchus placei]|uniref:PhoLip_ATPase_N domain-containing protein n=1 Tax=Haemonchus placei TaxID=6290 RepID=A0A0N4X720_HAEPC|nr:unnamed protein product [Haemonchus placei]